MTDVEAGLLQMLEQEPEEKVHQYAYHDWLLENGRAVDAKAVTDTCEGAVNKVEDLVGKLLRIAHADGDELTLGLINGTVCKLYHSQDCCESVYIESIDGDLNDLVGSPLTMAEAVDSGGRVALEGSDSSHTWTFYKFATVKGYVTVRWYGTSNGYYSESVDFKVNGDRKW